MYYYYVVMARALHALGQPTLDVAVAGGEKSARNWGTDLVARLSTLQNEDGSYRSVDDRWMEDNTVLITAYGLVALQHARGEE
jgi:squalene-hopene/tetraprenyl-beta-curcumene cyclase